MKKSYLAAVIPAAIVFGAGIFVLVLFLVKVVWAWTVPDLFPGAVEQGLIARSISWFTSLKLALFMAVLGGFSRAGSNSRSD